MIKFLEEFPDWEDLKNQVLELSKETQGILFLGSNSEHEIVGISKKETLERIRSFLSSSIENFSFMEVFEIDFLHRKIITIHKYPYGSNNL